MSERNFPSFLDAFMDYAKNVEAPEQFLKWSAMSIIAGALERKTWIRYHKEYIHPNEYVLLIGPSGLAKKSTSTKPAIDLLHQVKGIAFGTTQMTSASLVKQMKKIGEDKGFSHDGVKYKNSSMYIYSSEASVTLKEIYGGGNIIELLTDFWDCSPQGWNVDHCWSKETITGGRMEVYNPCVNMLACSTPEWLVKALGKDAVEGGFVSRVLFVVNDGQNNKLVPWEHNEEKALTDESMRDKLVQDLRHISKMHGQFTVTKGLVERSNEYRLLIQKSIKESKTPRLNNYFARKLWHTLKLTQIISASESNDMIATDKHIEKAFELVQSLEENMLNTFGLTGDNPKLQSLVSFWNVLRVHRFLTWKDISRIAVVHADIRTMKEHIEMLVKQERLKLITHEGDPRYEVIDPTPFK